MSLLAQLRALLVGVVSVCSFSTSLSATMTLEFKGIITLGDPYVGKELSGLVVFDPDMTPTGFSQSPTAVLATFATAANSPSFSSSVLSIPGALSISIGSNGTSENYGSINIGKSDNEVDPNIYQLQSGSRDSNGGNRFLVFSASDRLGLESMLFIEPGLALNQPVNFDAKGLFIFGSFGYQESLSAPLLFGQFTVVSATVVASPISEIETSVLLSSGLIVLSIVRRRWSGARSACIEA